MNDLEQIIVGGYCIGCGACSFATDGAVPVLMDEFGQFQADVSSVRDLEPDVLSRALLACPFSNEGLNEDAIGGALFGESCENDSSVGFYNDLGIGHVIEENFREIGTSGGIITWVLAELLKLGKIDVVIHVKKVKSPDDGVLFRYGISRTEEDIKAGAKARYYPVEMSEVLRQIKETPGRYAVVGLPCFIKAVRRCAEQDTVIKNRVAFCIGLVCGHLKSKAFGDCFAWQVGIPPGELKEVDFRVKQPDRPASLYGVYLRGGDIVQRRGSRELFGSWWGHNFFRYLACSYCDDVFAETADIVVGDAWLRPFSKDPKGNSVVVVRNETIRKLIETARMENRINFYNEPPDLIAASQAGGLRDRREGLAYRLFLKQKTDQFVPDKRVLPDASKASFGRRQIYRMRIRMEVASHLIWREAVTRSDWKYFEKKMNVLILQDRWLYLNVWKRCRQKVVGLIGRTLRLLKLRR